MPLFAITCLDKPDHLAVRLENRPAHLDYAKAILDRMVAGGPLLDDDGETMIGSLLIIEFADIAAARAWCADDPYAKAGLFESVSVRPFRKVLPTPHNPS